MWDLPEPGVEPVSPAMGGGFFTTESPGKPGALILIFAKSKTLMKMVCSTSDIIALFYD